MLVGLIVSALMLHSTNKFWMDNAVVTTLDTMEAPVSDIPFPAVTVCQESAGRVEPWNLPMKILDRLKFNCDPIGRSKSLPFCQEVKRNHEMLRPLKRHFYYALKEGMRSYARRHVNSTYDIRKLQNSWHTLEEKIKEGKLDLPSLHEQSMDRIGEHVYIQLLDPLLMRNNAGVIFPYVEFEKENNNAFKEPKIGNATSELPTQGERDLFLLMHSLVDDLGFISPGTLAAHVLTHLMDDVLGHFTPCACEQFLRTAKHTEHWFRSCTI